MNHNMTDYSFNTIIDTSTLQIGQVVRINFTDDGIFRVFYNDSNGNMYCGLNRQSNYRQVVADSAHKRTQIDISSSATDYIALNKFNPPMYGGTYHEEQMRIPIDRNDKNFYVFKYNILNENIFNHYTPVSFFSEIQSQSYIKQGSTSGYIYNSVGYSPILASGKNRFWSSLAVQPDCSFNESVGFFITTRNETTAARTDRNDISQPGVIPFPDYMDLYGQTITTITNKPLNTNYSHLSNLADIGLTGSGTDIRSRFGILNYPYIDTFSRDSNGTSLSIPSLAQSYNILYTLTQKRPKYVWLDISNNATSVDSNGSPGNGQEDTYYKGNFYLYAYTHRQSDVSGNIYIERHNRDNKPKARCEIFSNFANTKNLHKGDIRNIFLDMDLDISKNSTINSGNFNYIYSRPYYVICSDLSGQIVHGTIPYDLYGNSLPLPTEQHIVDISGMSKDQNPDDSLGNSNPFYDLVGTCAKYCKIMVDPTSLNWKTTRYHIIYYAQGGENETDSHTKNTLRWISGEGKSAYDLCGNITTVENSGLYPSMDMSGNVPYVAYLCKGNNNLTDISGIGYSYLDNTDANKENWIWTTPRLIATKEDLGGDLTKYTDVSNNHPISLKISPYDYSVHICYQKFNTDGKTSIGYWSNSKNTMDISGIDASLNFLGIKSYGKTIDVSAASVELFWDLSQCNCIFSRDYTRLDENGNTNGLTIPQRKIKIQGYPEGGRNGDFVKSIDEDGVITYIASALDKLYIIMNIKTPSSWGNTEALFLLGESSYQGAYKSFIDINGYVSFGITNQGHNSSKSISTNNTGVYYKLSYKTDNNNNITLYTGAESLDTNTNYKLEFYYDKSNYYGFIKTTILDTKATNLYEYFNIIDNGGFNMLDGNLSIGNGSHTADSNKITNVTIYKMSMYATDISNIPVFDVSRNGEILDDCSGTHFSSFFDNNGNTGLDIEPIINKYQVVNAVNSLNNGDISGSSYDKSVMLNDIYYLQQIEGYSQSSYGEVIKGISRFDDGEIWAHGYRYNNSGKTSKSTTFWRSFDNGLSWNIFSINVSGFENFTINNIATFTDDYTTFDGISGKWIYFCGNDDLIYFSSNYSNNQPSLGVLGNTWKKLDNGNYLSSTDVSLNYTSLNYTYIYPTLLDTTLSTNLFLTSPAANDFHLFMGTKSGEDRIIRMGKNKTQSTAAYSTFTPFILNFTNCGSTGKTGPTAQQCNSAYSGTDVSVTVNTRGYQEWTVPYTASYTIVATGASGGGTSSNIQSNQPVVEGQKGAQITGTFDLVKDEVIYIVVGQKPYRSGLSTGGFTQAGGGGGGTFIVKKKGNGPGFSSINDVLIVAGGGGGIGDTGSQFSSNYNNEMTPGSTSYTNSTNGGNQGSGEGGGGGGGFNSSGVGGVRVIKNGKGWKTTNGTPGEGGSNVYGGDSESGGGFGGGGAPAGPLQQGDLQVGGGGGGGMVGGDGGDIYFGDGVGGKGGGSYNAGTNVSASYPASEGHGSVVISFTGRDDTPATKEWDLIKNILYNEIISSGKPAESLNAISFGQPYRGLIDLSDNLSNLGFGIIGTNNHIYVTNNGGKNWTKKLDYHQSTGTTGVYVGQNTKYGDGDSAGDHTYDISGFHIQTNSKPWVGYNGFLVADNNNNYDVSFSPINNSISNPQLYTNNYWEPQATSLYKVPNTYRDIYDNNYKVIISNLENTNNKSGLKYQQNDIVFTQSNGDNNIFYLKNSDYNHWQKIDVSPINQNYNISQLNKDRFTNIIPIDISKTIVHIEGYNNYNNISGFYTVSKLPPSPELNVLYPVSSNNITLAILEILLDFNKKAYNLNGNDNTVILSSDIRLKYGIETEYQFQEGGKDWEYVPRSTGDNYEIRYTLNILEQGKRYIFRCRLKNKYGYSPWSKSTREISIPAYDPYITNLSYRNKILENKVLWNVGLTNNSQTVYAYDITKSYVNNRYQIVRDYDFDKKYYYNDISGVIGPYSFNFGELETVEWDETMSRDMSFNHIKGVVPPRNLITAGSDVSGNTFNWYYGISKYVIEKKPEIYDISINFQNVGGSFEFGLSDNSNNYSNIMDEFHYCFSMGVTQYNLRENGNNIFTGWQSTTNTPNDVFTIQITKNNEVKYYINNILKHTSSNTPTYPLYILYVPYYQQSEKKGIFNVQATKISPFDVSNNWTSRFDSGGNEIFDISKVSFIDKDVDFNTTYLYGITARAIPIDGDVKTENFETSISTDSGIPEKFNYNYKVNNANLTLSWTKVIDISDNISAVWDISWNEKRKDGTESNGIISIDDSSFPFTNGNASYIRTLDYSGATNTYLQPNADYSFQIRGKYSKPNQSNLPTFISEFSKLLLYYNYQEPPILKDVSYNLQTNRINALWTEPKRPSIPDYYDISMVNVTSKYDISYNFSQTLNSFSDNGLTYYPGKYKMRLRANFGGYQSPTDIGLNSEWSNLKEFDVPYHSIKNLKITPYNKNHIKDLVDVSYIRLDWDDMVKCNLSDNFGINIPDKFTVIRQWSSKGFNYLPDYEKVISKDSVSYLDQEYPLGSEITFPRQYKYDISANYNFDVQPPIIYQVGSGVVTTTLIDNTPEYTFYTDESGTIVITGASSDTKSASLGENTISFNTLAPGTYSNITIMIRDSVGNNSNILTVNTFIIEPFPQITEVTPVTPLSNNNTPTYTFHSDTAGTVIITGDGATASPTSAIIGNNTITFNPLSDGIYNIIIKIMSEGNPSNILTLSQFIIDTVAPQISEQTAVITPSTDKTPQYTFYSDKAGTIAISGDGATASPTSAIIGNNPIIFNILPEGTYNNIIITVTDNFGNISNILTVTPFTIEPTTIITQISEVTPVTTPTLDTTPQYTFLSNNTGTITISGASSETTDAIVGNNTITFNTLSPGTYNNITITVRDDGENDSNTLDVTSFTIQSPTISEVTPVTTPTLDTTPNYTFLSNKAGTIVISGDGATASPTSAIIGDNIITFNPLSFGTYNNITITVTDSDGNDSNTLTVTSFTIQPPTISEVTPVTTSTTDTTPNYTFLSNKAGTITISGDGATASPTSAIIGNNIITFNPLSDGIYSNITITVTDSLGNDSNTLAVNTFTVDTSAPQINEVTPVTTLSNDNTPQYTFYSNSAGTIAIYGDGATASPTSAIIGDNPITFNLLSDGIYSNITITVTDSAGNVSNALSVNSFTIDTSGPQLTEVTPISTTNTMQYPTNDWTTNNTPTYTFHSNSAGTITISGDGATASPTSAIVGNNPITFNPLSDGIYSNITITVTDSLENISNILSIAEFGVDTTGPTIDYAWDAFQTPSTTSFPGGFQIGQSITANFYLPYPQSAGFTGYERIMLNDGFSSSGIGQISGPGENSVQVFSTTGPGAQGVYQNWQIYIVSELEVQSNSIILPIIVIANSIFSVTSSGSSSYSISQDGTSLGNNPTLTLKEGEVYIFDINAYGHPFYIKTQNSTGTGNLQTSGIQSYGIDIPGQGAQTGALVFIVPYGIAPTTLYYNCQFHSSMNGTINIIP